jgi:hypothetical protein
MKKPRKKGRKKAPTHIIAVPRHGLPPVLLLPLEGNFTREEIRKAVRAVRARNGHE